MSGRFIEILDELLGILDTVGLMHLHRIGETLLAELRGARSRDAAECAAEFRSWFIAVAKALAVDLEPPQDDRPFWTQNL